MLRKFYLLLISIISFQVCLILVKSLTITSITREPRSDDQSVTMTDSSEAVIGNSSCSPQQYQLDYYDQLYSTKVADSFNGNTLYYALKAMKAHENVTESTATTENDHNAVIENITDQSRFTPAGMDTTNKVVCAKVLREMDEVVSSISKTALCSWDYICDYKARRYPNYLFKARCRTARCSNKCSQKTHNHSICQSHGIHITILEMIGDCEAWVWGQEFLPLACTCITNLMMKLA